MPIEEKTVAWIARTIPGAIDRLERYDIDYCCAGRDVLRDVMATRDDDASGLYLALTRLERNSRTIDWASPRHKLFVASMVEQFHARHRMQLSQLLNESGRVEKVHRHHPACPHGITEVIANLANDLGSHMIKEELILFPMLEHKTPARCLVGPIAVVEDDHVGHLRYLDRMWELSENAVAPADASTTWRDFYAHIKEFGRDLKFHIHLENNILFAV